MGVVCLPFAETDGMTGVRVARKYVRSAREWRLCGRTDLAARELASAARWREEAIAVASVDRYYEHEGKCCPCFSTF